jgi:TonB family protein
MPFFPAGLLMMGGMACTHGNRPVHVPQIVPPRLDAAHTPKLALPFSRSEHRSSAACTVQATVKTDGTVRDVSLAQSSGFQSIDEICVKGAKKVLFFPATKDGKPFQSSAQISLIWQLDHWEFRG